MIVGGDLCGPTKLAVLLERVQKWLEMAYLKAAPHELPEIRGFSP